MLGLLLLRLLLLPLLLRGRGRGCYGEVHVRHALEDVRDELTPHQSFLCELSRPVGFPCRGVYWCLWHLLDFLEEGWVMDEVRVHVMEALQV